MTGSRLGWMLLVLPVLVAPSLLHVGALGPSLALAAALLATLALVARSGVLPWESADRAGSRGVARLAADDRLRSPIRSCDPDARGHVRPRAPGRIPVIRA